MKNLLLLAIAIVICSGVCNHIHVQTDYNEPWNVPTISHSTTGFKYCYFGKIGYRDREYREDTLAYPPIPGLIHRSIYRVCPKDSCYAEYMTLALRCPSVKGLQKWLSKKVFEFVDDGPIPDIGIYQKPIVYKQCSTTEEACGYYADQLQGRFDSWLCPKLEEPDVNDQTGHLITDCWKTGEYYTFYEAYWYSGFSCGNHVKESYRTVDSRNGKELKLEDLVKLDNYIALDSLVKKHLVNDFGERWIDRGIEGDVLKYANGCALIREGFIVYYYPYNIGSGLDGEFLSIVPYEEMRPFLRI